MISNSNNLCEIRVSLFSMSLEYLDGWIAERPHSRKDEYRSGESASRGRATAQLNKASGRLEKPSGSRARLSQPRARMYKDDGEAHQRSRISLTL